MACITYDITVATGEGWQVFFLLEFFVPTVFEGGPTDGATPHISFHVNIMSH